LHSVQFANYRELADLVHADITAGRLAPGDRLPTQRQFADQHRIAMSTATRAYAELIRRGVATGEVGRGTFVRTGRPTTRFAIGQGIDHRINLATNVPLLPNQAALLTASAAQLTRRSAVIASAMETMIPTGTPTARRAVASFVARAGWRPDPDALVFTGNGRQALAAAITSLVPPGHRLGVEALSYQSVAGIAGRLGVEVVPLPMDEGGLRVDRLIVAHKRHRLRAIYVQPTLHNPLGVTMTAARRRELVLSLRSLDITAIEDHVYAFLADDPWPLASLSPDHVVMIDSLSKRVAPGLTLGWAVAAPRLVHRLIEAVRASALMPTGLALELGIRWIVNGTVSRLVKEKRRDAVARQRLIRKVCLDLTIRADPRAYHVWVELPGGWRAESFTAAAAERGIAVAPATAFAVGPGHAPNAVRLALASPTRRVLAQALVVLNSLARLEPKALVLE
jgi:DNA-binding transcriptional MocR family regulator